MFRKKTKNESFPTPDKKKGKKSNWIMFTVVLLLTLASLLFSFYSAGEGDILLGMEVIGQAIISCNPLWLLAVVAVFFFSFVLDGLAITIFCRLYTRRYYLHQGIANSLIGGFYNNVTPSSSGGQVMQVYTLKRQGIEVSNAASILVMWFIIYQLSLIAFGVISIAFEWNVIMSITSIQIPNFSLFGWNGDIPMLPLIIIGFVLNISLIALLLLMSYSHRFHNFIMHYAVGFLGKIHMLKDPDKTRENLRVQVENFKVELRRLQANIPVTILIFILFMLLLFCRFSVPYFAGLALNAYGAGEGFSIAKMFDACFRSSFHQMVTGLIIIPGAAGVSELVYAAMFNGFFVETFAVGPHGLTLLRSASANMMASQIIWRFVTFYLLMIVSGLVALLYRSRGGQTIRYVTRQTFIDLQSVAVGSGASLPSETLYETKQLSIKSIRKRLRSDVARSQGLLTGDDYVGIELSVRDPHPIKQKKEGGTSLID